MTGRDSWLAESKARTRSALAGSAAPADRLALMRTLAWFSGGRIDLEAEGLIVEPLIPLLPRFGLLPVANRQTLRLGYDDDSVLPGLTDALAIDPGPRTVFPQASPDMPLLRFSNHETYRSATQKAAVNALVTMPPAAALMVSMPTGSGKSLLFQIAPRWWRAIDPGACIVVVTPTVALADDHERTLRQLPGLENSRALTGAVSAAARTEILNAFRRGEIPVLLVSPETACTSIQSELLETALPPSRKHGLQARLVGFFVDEAHIVESWGRTFRPDFQRLPALVGALRENNPDLRVVLLSATLTRAARDVLRRSYADVRWLEIHAGVPRYDFDILVQPFQDETLRNETVLQVIDRAPRPAIVYTTQVEHADDLYRQLTHARGYQRVALFTGDVTDAVARRRIVADWAEERLDLVVATSAFGLGIDKQNVRTVIHACLPESPARYYQEIGRASRDGHQGIAICLWTRWRPGLRNTDDQVAEDMATTSWLSRDLAQARWIALRQVATTSWNGASRRLRVPLDAAREGLGRWTGEHNRRWNMSLLNLLQRAHTIRVEHVSEPEKGCPVWDLILLDDGLLAEGPRWNAAWDRIFATREVEREFAKREMKAFKSVLGGRKQECLLTSVFELIEPDATPSPPCGRCPTCRQRGVAPPASLPIPHTGIAWPNGAIAEMLPAGLLLLIANDPSFGGGLPHLLARLVSVGIEQFIVPHACASTVAQIISCLSVRFGLVHDEESWFMNPDSAADLPTAILLSEAERGPKEWIRQLGETARSRPLQSLIIVGDARLRSWGPLRAVVQLAPYYEEALDALAGTDTNVEETT